MDVRTSKRQARMIRRLALATLLLAGLLVTAPADANAQESKGVRMGVSGDVPIAVEIVSGGSSLLVIREW